MDFKIIDTSQAEKPFPPRIVIYGEPKIGKSTFASQAPDVFFIDVENGLNYLSVKKTPHIKSFDEVIEWLKHIKDNKDFKFKFIALDSLDWLEQLAQEKISKMYNAISIDDPSCKAFAYGAGHRMAANEVEKVLKWLDQIYKEKSISSILIAHTKIKEVNNPIDAAYQKYTLKLSTALAGKLNEWADLILFAKNKFYLTKDGKASEAKPVLLSSNNPSFDGGGRMKLPGEIDLSFEALQKALTTKKEV